MIKYLDDITQRLELIVQESNNEDRLKASRMLREMTQEYGVLNLENKQATADFIRKYQYRYFEEFVKR